jgi:hypothetical protein
MSPIETQGDPAAFAAYEAGREAFFARDLDTAHAAFGRAHRQDTRDPRFMSWFGVTLVLVERNFNLGVQLCDQALRSAGPDPELLLNLARVHLALNQRERVVRAISRGLELWPDDAQLQAARDAVGIRRAPVLRFLSRGNPLNNLLGRIRYHWQRRKTPAYELSPFALGVPLEPAPPAPRS